MRGGRKEGPRLRTSRTHFQIFHITLLHILRGGATERVGWWPTWQEVSGGFQVLGLEDEAGWVAWAACPPSSQPSPTTRSTSAATSPSTAAWTHPSI